MDSSGHAFITTQVDRTPSYTGSVMPLFNSSRLIQPGLIKSRLTRLRLQLIFLVIRCPPVVIEKAFIIASEKTSAVASGKASTIAFRLASAIAFKEASAKVEAPGQLLERCYYNLHIDPHLLKLDLESTIHSGPEPLPILSKKLVAFRLSPQGPCLQFSNSTLNAFIFFDDC